MTKLDKFYQKGPNRSKLWAPARTQKYTSGHVMPIGSFFYGLLECSIRDMKRNPEVSPPLKAMLFSSKFAPVSWGWNPLWQASTNIREILQKQVRFNYFSGNIHTWQTKSFLSQRDKVRNINTQCNKFTFIILHYFMKNHH